MRGADELRNVGSQVVGDVDGVETYGSACLVRTARSDELLALGDVLLPNLTIAQVSPSLPTCRTSE